MPSSETPEAPDNRIISVAKAKEMYDLYTSNSGQASNTRLGQIDFQELKDYVDFVSSLNDELVASGQNKVESFRIYFGRYPSTDFCQDGTQVISETIDGIPYTYHDHNTFMIVPTTMINGEQKAFMYKKDKGNIEIVSLEFQSSHNSLILNEFNLKPPPNEPDDFSIL